jgi:ferredoxin-thioredoxin reductase catalytic subunit
VKSWFLETDFLKEIFWDFEPYRSVVINVSVCLVRERGGSKLFRNLSNYSPNPALGIPKCPARNAIKNWTEHHHYRAWIVLPGHRYGKRFIDRPCKERADDLLKLSRQQLKMVVAILTGHAPVRRHLYIMGMFNEEPSCRFCRMETERVQHIVCSCEVLARERYNAFGKLFAEPKDISTASVRDFCACASL